jgi:hypothetical protein
MSHVWHQIATLLRPLNTQLLWGMLMHEDTWGGWIACHMPRDKKQGTCVLHPSTPGTRWKKWTDPTQLQGLLPFWSISDLPHCLLTRWMACQHDAEDVQVPMATAMRCGIGMFYKFGISHSLSIYTSFHRKITSALSYDADNLHNGEIRNV